MIEAGNRNIDNRHCRTQQVGATSADVGIRSNSFNCLYSSHMYSIGTVQYHVKPICRARFLSAILLPYEQPRARTHQCFAPYSLYI